VCIKNCILFRKEYADFDNCPKCGESRWKNVEAKKTPQKVLRHFPLITRLQRKKSPNEARWNKLYRKPKVGKDLGEMSHPADGKALLQMPGILLDLALLLMGSIRKTT
jgi:ssDNA-binding Zn-finger/Zn-ribbon topoisomerase 1